MMGLQFTRADSMPVIRITDRKDHDISARFLAPFREGVFLVVRLNSGNEVYLTQGYYYDFSDRKIHKINIPEITKIHSAVVAGQTAWFSGETNGESQLIGIDKEGRIQLSLPEKEGIPQLGLNGQHLLIIYPDEVFRLEKGEWQRIYAGNIVLPRSGPPPKQFGDKLYFRDEGHGEDNKRLSWIDLKKPVVLHYLDEDVGLVGSSGPNWENVPSYHVTEEGTLWAAVGRYGQSVLHRTANGKYSIATLNKSVRFTPDLRDSGRNDQGLFLSAVASDSGGRMLFVGGSGLYRLDGLQLKQELAFTNASQKIPIKFNNRDSVLHWSWDPTQIITLQKDSYFISGEFGGVYHLERDTQGNWKIESLDEELGHPVSW